MWAEITGAIGDILVVKRKILNLEISRMQTCGTAGSKSIDRYKDGFTRRCKVLRLRSGNGELRVDVISDIVSRRIGFDQSELCGVTMAAAG